MTLGAALERYVTLKRALGAVFSVDARILRAFARRVGDVPLASISAAACQAFCQGAGPPTRFTLRKHESLRGFFRYLVGRGDLRASPLPEPAPPVRSAFRPYIYSRDELRRCDVDLAERVLTIWDTKFFKSRLVPLGASLGAALARYWSWRARLPLPGGDRAPFFATRIGQTIPLARLEQAFVRLRQQAGVRRPPSERWQPRLHDLRATFAVHRLLAWYREGADLHARLPLLATSLGHTTLAGTQTYLTLTPELLGEASRRFLRYASPAEEDTHV